MVYGCREEKTTRSGIGSGKMRGDKQRTGEGRKGKGRKVVLAMPVGASFHGAYSACVVTGETE